MLENPSARASRRGTIRLLVGFAAAVVWVVLVRVPLVWNARDHLDSDLAVDGITLREAVAGHWRWHYPGTPHMGILPVLYSLPQAIRWGAGPTTLVSGGVVAYVALVAATFFLAWRGFGREVAAWSLVPLAFGSTGALWLSGRITGGHLTAATWHALTFAVALMAFERGGYRRAAALGFCCGLGLYLDSLYVVTLAGLLPMVVIGVRSSRDRPSLGPRVLVVLAAFLAGVAPRWAGSRIDPYDAYREQFAPSTEPRVLLDHARILCLDCLPRLVVGHRLPRLEADPDPRGLAGPGPASPRPDGHPAAMAVTVLGLSLFATASLALVFPIHRRNLALSDTVRAGLLVSAFATVAGFILNRNIFNSDNYRYLVDLLVPWSIGFGLLMSRLRAQGQGGATLAALLAISLAGLMTIDAGRWYTRLGWLDEEGWPRSKATRDPALRWLAAHREVDRLLGGYWDVYRLCFLSPHPLRGTPYPIYPDRFPEWKRADRGDQPGVVIGRGGPATDPFVIKALEQGGRTLYRADGIQIVSWPQ